MEINKKNTMSLEPRLIEYIRKMKYYKKHDIDPGMMDIEFQITPNDKRIIRAHLRGENNIHNKKEYNQFSELKMDNHKFKYNKLKNDKRMDKINKAKDKDKEMIKNEMNSDIYRNMFDEDREYNIDMNTIIDHRDFGFDSGKSSLEQYNKYNYDKNNTYKNKNNMNEGVNDYIFNQLYLPKNQNLNFENELKRGSDKYYKTMNIDRSIITRKRSKKFNTTE